MAFFKSFRDQLKANALVSQLEFARNRYSSNPELGRIHLASALKALAEIKSCGAEKALTFTGWKYVVAIALELGMMIPTQDEKEMVRDLDFIIEQATIWRDEAYERESN